MAGQKTLLNGMPKFVWPARIKKRQAIIFSISSPEKGHILDCDQLQVITESKTTIWLILGSVIQDLFSVS